MKQSFLSQLIARLGSETPLFFKSIIAFGVTLGVIGAAILGVPELAKSANLVIELPPLLVKVAGYLCTAGFIAAAVGKTATTNPTLQAQGGSNVVVNEKHDGESTSVAKAPTI